MCVCHAKVENKSKVVFPSCVLLLLIDVVRSDADADADADVTLWRCVRQTKREGLH